MKEPKKIQGIIIPMVTPVTGKLRVDIKATRKITDYLVREEVSPFIQGTTGEGLSISDDERLRFAEAVVNECSGKVPVYAAISHHSFSSSVDLGRRYFDMGIDMVVAHLPGFYPMADEQIIRFYERLAEAVAGPLVIYNIPKTVHRSIPLQVVEELSHHPDICGIKDSENDMERLEEAISRWKDRKDFSHLTGWAAQSAYALSRGSDGIVPSTGNIVPHLYRQLYKTATEGEIKGAEKLQEETDTISRIYQEGRSLSESLAALKAAMDYFGFCEPHMLPPLTECTDEEKKEISSKIVSCKSLDFLKG